jgi:hypothetical protein
MNFDRLRFVAERAELANAAKPSLRLRFPKHREVCVSFVNVSANATSLSLAIALLMPKRHIFLLACKFKIVLTPLNWLKVLKIAVSKPLT